MRKLSLVYLSPISEEKMEQFHDGIIKLLNKLEIDSLGILSDMPYNPND